MGLLVWLLFSFNLFLLIPIRHEDMVGIKPTQDVGPDVDLQGSHAFSFPKKLVSRGHTESGFSSVQSQTTTGYTATTSASLSLSLFVSAQSLHTRDALILTQYRSAVETPRWIMIATQRVWWYRSRHVTVLRKNDHSGNKQYGNNKDPDVA